MPHPTTTLSTLGAASVLLALVLLGLFVPVATAAVADTAHAFMQSWARQAAALTSPV